MIDREPRTWPALAAITLARLSHDIAMQQGALLDALCWLGHSRVVPSPTRDRFACDRRATAANVAGD